MIDKKEKAFEQFEAMGEDAVRIWIGKEQPQSYESRVNHSFAVEWLGKKDQANRLRSEASQSESLEVAKSAKDAAWEAAKAAREAAREAKTANTIATLALIAAVVAMAIAIIGLFARR